MRPGPRGPLSGVLGIAQEPTLGELDMDAPHDAYSRDSTHIHLCTKVLAVDAHRVA